MLSLDWLKKIFGAKKDDIKKEELKTNTFSIETLKNFLDDRYTNATNPFFETAKSKYSEIQSAVNDFQNSLKVLGEAEYTDRVDRGLLSAITERRKNFIQKMDSVVVKLRVPIDFNFDSILDYHNLSVSSLNHANTTTVNDYAYITELFKKEAYAVVNKFKNLESLLSDFGNLVQSSKGPIITIHICKDRLEEMTKTVLLISKKKKVIEEISTKINNLDGEQIKILNKIPVLDNSKEWENFNDMLKRKTDLQNKLTQLLNEATQKISPLAKPIKKFKNLIDNQTIIFKDKKFVELFLENGVDTILHDDTSIFMSLLEDLERTVLDKKIDLKERKNKILDLINEFKKSNVFSRIKTEFEMLSNDINNLEDKIANSQVQAKRRKLEMDLESIKRMKNDYDAELSKEKSKLESLKSLLEKKKTELEEEVGHIAKNKIILDLQLNKL